jgi:hypothetical protein
VADWEAKLSKPVPSAFAGVRLYRCDHSNHTDANLIERETETSIWWTWKGCSCTYGASKKVIEDLRLHFQ